MAAPYPSPDRPLPPPLSPRTSSTRPRWPKTLTLWSEILLSASLFLLQLEGFLHRWLAWGDFSHGGGVQPDAPLTTTTTATIAVDDDDVQKIRMQRDDSGGNLGATQFRLRLVVQECGSENLHTFVARR